MALLLEEARDLHGHIRAVGQAQEVQGLAVVQVALGFDGLWFGWMRT
jgi:hypothetical protein